VYVCSIFIDLRAKYIVGIQENQKPAPWHLGTHSEQFKSLIIVNHGQDLWCTESRNEAGNEN
jgi:hypothetical protein